MLQRTSPRSSSLHGSFLLVAALLAGCGGKVLVDGVAADGAGGAGGTSGTGGATSQAVTGTSTAQGTGGFSTATSGTVTSTTTGTVSATSTGTDMTSTATVGVTATSAGAGGAAPVPQVFCNGQPCNDGEICCFNLTKPTDHCGQAGACGDSYIELACNGPEDCPNSEICCGNLDPNQGMVPYTAISCQATCAGMDHIIVCGDAGSAVCNPGESCKKSMTLGNGYRVCRP